MVVVYVAIVVEVVVDSTIVEFQDIARHQPLHQRPKPGNRLSRGLVRFPLAVVEVRFAGSHRAGGMVVAVGCEECVAGSVDIVVHLLITQLRGLTHRSRPRAVTSTLLDFVDGEMVDIAGAIGIVGVEYCCCVTDEHLDGIAVHRLPVPPQCLPLPRL